MKAVALNTLIAIIISVVTIIIYHHLFDKDKIGYVKSGIMVSEYKEMKAANEQFAKEAHQVEANLDTLKNRYLQLKQSQNIDASKEERQELAYQLNIAENEYKKYMTQSEQQMEARKQELTSKVLEKVNTHIQEFGKKHQYKLILGTTNDGSILYGSEADDLTSVILKQLNDQN